MSREKSLHLVDRFTYAGGTREAFGIVDDGNLAIRARKLPDGQSVAINLDDEGAERMGIMLCRFLEYTKQAKEKSKAKMEAKKK